GCEQFVDEAVFAAAQAQRIEARGCQEFVRVVPTGMRRGEDDGDGLSCRTPHHDRGGRSRRGGGGDGPGPIEAVTERAVTTQACSWPAGRVFFVDGWARSSAGEHCLDMAGATGSIPVAPTIRHSPAPSWAGSPWASVRLLHRLIEHTAC